MKNNLIVIMMISLIAFSCGEDFLTEQPVNIITTDDVIFDAASADAAVLGVYSRMQTGGMFGDVYINMSGVASDELVHSGSFPSWAEVDQNNVNSANPTIDGLWQQGYTTIYQCNNILELLESDQEFAGLTQDQRTIYIGEARFARALAHMMMTVYWGDIPLATTTDLETLSSVERTPQAQVYQFIIDEAQAAATELQNAEFTAATTDQFRASVWAARALEARARLYNGDVSGAGAIADDIITNGPFELADTYAELFQPGPAQNSEIIFSIFYSSADQNGIAFQYRPDGRFEYAVSPQLLAALEGTDRADLIELNEGDALGRHFVNKYSDVATGTDGVIVFRLAELYMIRAEANAGTATAQADINALRSRVGLDDISLSQANLDGVLAERFAEFFAEGHRWQDLVRTGQVDAVMGAISGANWQSTDALFPVPQRDIIQNPNLSQNPGY